MTFKMNITKIELVNFRNYKKKIFDNFSNLNIIIGKNGVGKTSIVEAIYLGSLAKSFKTNNDESIINLNLTIHRSIFLSPFSCFSIKFFPICFIFSCHFSIIRA